MCGCRAINCRVRWLGWLCFFLSTPHRASCYVEKQKEGYGLAEPAGRAKSRAPRVESVVPAARRIISSLRDIGYELPQAVADLVDNSVAAQATRVSVDLHFEG